MKKKPGARVNAQVLVIAEEDEDLWNSDEYSSDEEEPETKAPAEHVGETSLHRIIYTGSRGNSLTEEEIMQIQLQRQSRTVNYDAGKKGGKCSVHIQNSSCMCNANAPFCDTRR